MATRGCLVRRQFIADGLGRCILEHHYLSLVLGVLVFVGTDVVPWGLIVDLSLLLDLVLCIPIISFLFLLSLEQSAHEG